MMQIIDINGTERTIKELPTIITHIRKNEVGKVFHENVDGKLVTKKDMREVEVEEKFIQVIIVGKNREWKEWYPLEKFEKMNPRITL